MTARDRAHAIIRENVRDVLCGMIHSQFCDAITRAIDEGWRAGRDAAAKVCDDYAFGMADDPSCPRIAVHAAHTCVDHIRALEPPR